MAATRAGGLDKKRSCPRREEAKMLGTRAELCQLTTLRKGTKGSRWQVLLLEWERVQGKIRRKVGNRKIGAFPHLGPHPQLAP